MAKALGRLDPPHFIDGGHHVKFTSQNFVFIDNRRS